MKWNFVKTSFAQTKADFAVVLLPQGFAPTTPGFKDLDSQLDGYLTRYTKDQKFEGKDGACLVVNTLGRMAAQHVALVGCGKATEINAETIRRAAAKAAGAIKARHGSSFSIAFSALGGMDETSVAGAFAEGFHLAGYTFTRYKTEKDDTNGASPAEARIAGHHEAATAKALETASIIAEATCFARDLGNTPAVDLNPENFAAEAQKLASKHKSLKVKVRHVGELEKEGFNLILAVGAGSRNHPCLVRLEYTPTGKAPKGHVALVGKGMTFDSGGLCIKTAEGMLDMKFDMMGAAACLAAMQGIAKLGLKKRVVAYIPLAENMPDGAAYRPSDVFRAYNGKTVEVINTDAEGRLILADALALAAKEGAEAIVDLATLTGACAVALGSYTNGLFSDHAELAAQLKAAGQAAGDDIHQLPLTKKLKDQLKSNIADIKHTGSRYGGAITAALFLQNFTGTTPWAHVDIAGPAWTDTAYDYHIKGATGTMTRTMIHWVKGLAG